MNSAFVNFVGITTNRALVLVMLLASGCSGDDTQFSTRSTENQLNASAADKNTRTIKDVKWPKSDMTSHGEDNAIENIDLGDRKIVGSRQWKNVVWLNFNGATITKDESFIVANQNLETVTIPPFVGDDVSSQLPMAELTGLITDKVRSLYSGVDVTFVTERQNTKDPVTVIHIGGTSFIPKPGIVGRAPMDFDNFNGNDIGFVFSQEFRGRVDGEAVTLLAQTIAHETAHALGLRHIENEKSIMFPNATLLSNSFNEEGPVSGASDPAPIENSLAVLLKNAGVADPQEKTSTLPKISFLSSRSKGNVGQFSVFDLRNIESNPRHQLGDFEYLWSYGDLEPVQGPSMRIAFADGEEAEIRLTVRSGNNAQNYVFRVKKP